MQIIGSVHVKRNGEVVAFNPEKIEHAIFKAMRSIGNPNRKKANELSLLVVNELIKSSSEKTPTVEQVQDFVEKILFEFGDFELLKSYLIYRKQHEQLRNAKELFSNIEVMDDYLSMSDWRVKESANSAYSLQGLNQHISTAITSQYWLTKLYSNSISDAHKQGYLHIHDSMSFS